MIYDLLRMRKNAFTLIELLVGFAIIAIMIVISVATLNSIGLTNKGRDAQRKKDLNRIKIAFEEYYNDKSDFPTGDLLDDLNNKSNCGTGIFMPYLNTWPCDPNGQPYLIGVETGLNKYKVVTNLENKADRDIPANWYSSDQTVLNKSVNEVNYGVSSSNILWYNPITKEEYESVGCDTSTCVSTKYGNCTHNSECSGDLCYFFNTSGRQCNGVCATSQCPLNP